QKFLFFNLTLSADGRKLPRRQHADACFISRDFAKLPVADARQSPRRPEAFAKRCPPWGSPCCAATSNWG
ncbi:TPA: hypothetical protein ACXJE6_006108, partial [Burkholderia contaminans]